MHEFRNEQEIAGIRAYNRACVRRTCALRADLARMRAASADNTASALADVRTLVGSR